MEKVYIFSCEELKTLWDIMEFYDTNTKEQEELKNKIIGVFLK